MGTEGLPEVYHSPCVVVVAVGCLRLAPEAWNRTTFEVNTCSTKFDMIFEEHPDFVASRTVKDQGLELTSSRSPSFYADNSRPVSSVLYKLRIGNRRPKPYVHSLTVRAERSYIEDHWLSISRLVFPWRALAFMSVAS